MARAFELLTWALSLKGLFNLDRPLLPRFIRICLHSKDVLPQQLIADSDHEPARPWQAHSAHIREARILHQLAYSGSL
jgi:hypothetical protein